MGRGTSPGARRGSHGPEPATPNIGRSRRAGIGRGSSGGARTTMTRRKPKATAKTTPKPAEAPVYKTTRARLDARRPLLKETAGRQMLHVRSKFSQSIIEKLPNDPVLAAFLERHAYVTPSRDGKTMRGSDAPISHERSAATRDLIGRPPMIHFEGAHEVGKIFRLKK